MEGFRSPSFFIIIVLFFFFFLAAMCQRWRIFESRGRKEIRSSFQFLWSAERYIFSYLFLFSFCCLLVCLLLPLDRCKSDGMSRVCCSRLLIGSCSRCARQKKKEKRRDERLDRTSALRDPPTSFFLGGFSFFTFFSFLYFYFSLFLSLVL